MLGILAVCCEIIYNILPQLVTCLLTLITVFLVMLLLLLSHEVGSKATFLWGYFFVCVVLF